MLKQTSQETLTYFKGLRNTGRHQQSENQVAVEFQNIFSTIFPKATYCAKTDTIFF